MSPNWTEDLWPQRQKRQTWPVHRSPASLGHYKLMATGLVMGLLITVSCGEFRTRRFYVEADETTPQPDVVAECDGLAMVEIATQILPGGRRGVPYIAAFTAQTAGPIQWRIVSGELPGGLDLDPSSGLLAGVPESAGQFPFTVEAAPDEATATCTAPSRQKFMLIVDVQCESSQNCLEQVVLSDSETQCVENVCAVSTDECPLATLGARTAWDGESLSPTAKEWDVVAHRKLLTSEQSPKDPYSHILTLSGNDAEVLLPYTLPDGLPLPFAPGDTVKIASSSVAYPIPGKMLAVEDAKGHRPVLLYDGPLINPPEDSSCTLGSCFVQLERWPLQCPGQWIPECGIAGPDTIAVAVQSTTVGAAHVGSPLDVELPGGPARVIVTEALSYASFDALECRGEMPLWASLFFFPLDSCPVARITVAQTAGPPGPATKPECRLKQGFTGHLVECQLHDAHDSLPSASFISGSSYSLADRGIMHRIWKLSQPVEGLIELYAKGAALDAQVLYPPLCGTYRVALEVVDDAGASSCVDDAIEVRVIPNSDYDLRVELTWQKGEDLDAQLLLMYPQFGQSWSDDKWVCSRQNPSTPAWALDSEQMGGQVCHLAPGDMVESVPEVLTMRELRQEDKPVNLPPYKLGVAAPQSNKGPVLITVRVYVGGSPEPAYQRLDRAIAPGVIWSPGGISSKYMSFIPASQPYAE